MGHVFWDQETWMYPPILLLHSKIGKAIVKTRTRTMEAAKETARMRGYKGAMYPWETALSGRAMTTCNLHFITCINDITFHDRRQQLYRETVENT